MPTDNSTSCLWSTRATELRLVDVMSYHNFYGTSPAYLHNFDQYDLKPESNPYLEIPGIDAARDRWRDESEPRSANVAYEVFLAKARWRAEDDSVSERRVHVDCATSDATRKYGSIIESESASCAPSLASDDKQHNHAGGSPRYDTRVMRLLQY